MLSPKTEMDEERAVTPPVAADAPASSSRSGSLSHSLLLPSPCRGPTASTREMSCDSYDSSAVGFCDANDGAWSTDNGFFFVCTLCAPVLRGRRPRDTGPESGAGKVAWFTSQPDHMPDSERQQNNQVITSPNTEYVATCGECDLRGMRSRGKGKTRKRQTSGCPQCPSQRVVMVGWQLCLLPYREIRLRQTCPDRNAVPTSAHTT
jgi:hypothetical protein